MLNNEECMKVAVAQISSADDIEANLRVIEKLAVNASQESVQLLVLPENAVHMPRTSSEQWVESEHLENECLESEFIESSNAKAQIFLADLARQTNLWIIVGSMAILVEGNEKPYARCLVFNPKGELVTHYDKVHLFDVDIPNGLKYKESDSYIPGSVQQSTQVVDTSFALVGLSICYDLRFPELYRNLVNSGAQIICVPAAFTYDTGEAHWLTLLRARAIENQVYILASAQTGTHASGRKTWGHSMVIDPWGKVLANANDEVNTLVICQIDLIKQSQLRAKFPVLTHQRLN